MPRRRVNSPRASSSSRFGRQETERHPSEESTAFTIGSICRTRAAFHGGIKYADEPLAGLELALL